MDIIKEIENLGLTAEQYESCLSDICDKLNGELDIEWEEIKDKYHLPWNKDTLRKASGTLLGGYAVAEYYKTKKQNVFSKDDIDNRLEQLRKEKIKLQTLNMERSRLDRESARQELFYENIGKNITTLPLPQLRPIIENISDTNSYVVALSDLHYGSTFKSENNEYSREIFKERLEYLLSYLIEFVKQHHLSTIAICALGDSIQGILRVSDIRINDTNVVQCIVEISRLIATFLNELSAYVEVDYYHVPSANHTQLRPIGTKSTDLIGEDFEYVISNYIKDLLVANNRIHVHLAEEGKQYIKLDIPCLDVYAMHGHQFKDTKASLKDLSHWLNANVDVMLLGHFHAGSEFTVGESFGDCEVLVAPSFIGSDPFSDRLMRGSKASVKIYGFDAFGHVESYKVVLN